MKRADHRQAQSLPRNTFKPALVPMDEVARFPSQARTTDAFDEFADSFADRGGVVDFDHLD